MLKTLIHLVLLLGINKAPFYYICTLIFLSSNKVKETLKIKKPSIFLFRHSGIGKAS